MTDTRAPVLPARRRWDWRTRVFVLLGIAAVLVGVYPFGAQWWNSHIQSEALRESNQVVQAGPQERFDAMRRQAEEFNSRLSSGLDVSDYLQQIDPFGTGQMGRIRIDAIDVDLPIYHTSSDAVLRKGAGHMEETSLPVGGAGTHAAITAHRGLAESVLFTHLDRLRPGDTFVLEVLGVPQVYRVFETRIVAPDETDWLLIDHARDLVTLITCDPIGINTERMLVTGERVTPTPLTAVESLAADPTVPGFPWFAVFAAAGTVAVLLIARLANVRAPRPEPAGTGAVPAEPESAEPADEKEPARC